MKEATSDLIALLESARSVSIADLYTITLANGTEYRASSFDADLWVGGHLFPSYGALFERDRIRLVRGLEVDHMTLRINAREVDKIFGIPLMQAVQSGIFDGAYVLVQRLFMPAPGDTSVAPVTAFKGRVSETTNSRSFAELTIASTIELFDIQFPRFVYQPGCGNTLYDAVCGLNKASWMAAGETRAGSTLTRVICNLGYPDGYFNLGTVTFYSGENTGISRTIKYYGPGTIDVAYPLPSAPKYGDLFRAYPGCDKTMSHCTNRFNNIINFNGMPFIPKPEVTL